MMLLTSLYYETDANRRGELLECLRRNLAAAELDEIHVFLEDATIAAELKSRAEFNCTKIRLVQQQQRVTYRKLFDYANSYLTGQRVIIANADIFFDETW